MAVAVVAEKPSVARDIARVLEVRTRGEGALTGNGYVVTWAIGHLVALAPPHEIRAEWKRWTPEHLPLIPDRWPLVVLPETKRQLEVVASVLRDPAVDRVVCATDAGREGELIFRYIYEKTGCRKPVSRLWLAYVGRSAGRSRAHQQDGSQKRERKRERATHVRGNALAGPFIPGAGCPTSIEGAPRREEAALFDDPAQHRGNVERPTSGRFERLVRAVRHEHDKRVFDSVLAPGRLGQVARLGPTAVILKKGAMTILDGPFAETKEQILGFFIVECATPKEAGEGAKELGAASSSGGSYEIRPIRVFAENGVTP